MKRLFLLLSILFCVDAVAQMLPDSTVAVMAHWRKGLTVSYKVTKDNYKIVGNDTTEFKSTTEKIVLKVIKATKDSYKMRLSQKDYEFKGDDPKGIYAAMATVKGSDIIYTTDIYGSLVSIDNLEEIREEGLQALRLALDAAEQKTGQKLSPEAVSYMEKLITDPSVIKQSLIDYTKIFSFHGVMLKVGEVVESEVQIPSILPGFNTPLKAKSVIYFDPELTDSETAVGRIVIRSDSEDSIKFLSDGMSGLGVQNGLSPDVVNQVIEAFRAGEMKYEEFLSTEVHLATGLPVVSYYDKIVSLVADGVNVCHVRSESVEFL